MDIKEVKKAIDALEKQGCRSTNGINGCFYSHKGLCCIVGHMMPDDATRKSADIAGNSSIDSLFEDGFEWAKQFTRSQIGVLKKLQKIHDEDKRQFSKTIKSMRYLINDPETVKEWYGK